MVGEMPVERSTQLLLLTWTRRRLRERIHGRPRSDRKKRFLLSAVAPSTITRHPREAKPINGHSAVGLRQARNSLLTPRPHFAAPSCTLVTRWLLLRTALLFHQERRPTRVCRTPGVEAVCSPQASTLRAGTANIPPCRTARAPDRPVSGSVPAVRAPGCGHLSAHQLLTS